MFLKARKKQLSPEQIKELKGILSQYIFFLDEEKIRQRELKDYDRVNVLQQHYTRAWDMNAILRREFPSPVSRKKRKEYASYQWSDADNCCN